MRRLINAFLDRLSTLLLWFGVGLLAIGVVVQIARAWQMHRVDHDARTPPFDDTFQVARARAQGRQVAPALSPEAEQPRPVLATPRRILIPSVGIDTPVVEVGVEARIVNGEKQGNVWQTADYAAGHHQASALPGEPENMVVSGHNNVQGAVFRNLYKVVPGDLVYVDTLAGRRFTYEVVESFVVPEEDATPEQRLENTYWIRPSDDERLTLVSCFPPWSNTHRAIVVAFPAVGETATATPVARAR